MRVHICDVRSQAAFARVQTCGKPIGFPVGPSGTTQKPSVSGHFYIIGVVRVLQKRQWNRCPNRRIIKNRCGWRDFGRPHGKTQWVHASFSLLDIRGGRAAAAVTKDLAPHRARHFSGRRSVGRKGAVGGNDGPDSTVASIGRP